MYVNDDNVFLIISSLSLCVFSESSLTSKNLSTVLDIMMDRLWSVFGHCVTESELSRIRSQYSVREHKQAVIDLFISKHPAPSWTLVAHTLYKMGRLYVGDVVDVGVSCLKSLHLLQQLFPTGIYNIHIVHTSLCVYCTQCICISS